MKQFLALLFTISSIQAQPIVPVPTGPETQVTRTLKTNATHQSWRDALDVPGYTNWTKDVSAPARFTSSLVVSNTPGPGKTNYASGFFIDGALSVARGEVDLRAFGAVEGGVEDSFEQIQEAVDYCVANGLALIWRGDYASSQTITLPSGIRIIAMPMDYTYKVNPRGVQGGSLTMLANVSAFQTVRLSPPSDTIGFWARDINIEKLYIKGTQVHLDSETSSVGLDLTGCYSSRFSGHVEGFGIGILTENVAELDIADSIIQNCYYGLIIRRDPPAGGRVYDAIVNVLNVLNVNNQIPLLLDNVRYAGIFGGEIISNVTNTGPVKVVNTRDDSTIIFHGMKAFENQSHTALIVVDTNGLGNLSMEKCNSAVNNFNQPIVDVSGYFNSIKITDNQLQRTTGTNKIAPLVWARRPPSDENNYVRANSIEVHGNDPHWFDAFVRNDQLMSRPENDFVPPGYVHLNPLMNTGSAGEDGIISVAGDYAFTTNSMTGIAKVFWQNVATNNVYSLLTPTNLTKGIDHIYVTATLYDNDEDDIPILNVQGWGDQGEWNRISQSKIGSFTNPTTGVVFSKWAWCVTVQDQSKATNGLSHVQLFDIFGTTASDRSEFGLERFCVYAPIQKNPYSARQRTSPTVPGSGLEGWAKPGDVIWNDFTSTTSPNGWINRSLGNPGQWNAIGDVWVVGAKSQYEFPYFSAADNRLGGSGVYGRSTGGRLAIGTSSTDAASRLVITDNTAGPMIHISNARLGENTIFTFSDIVDHSWRIGHDAVNNYAWIGESTTHLALKNGRVGIGNNDPTQALDVTGNGLFSGTVTGTSGTFGSITLNGDNRSAWPTDSLLVKVSSGDTTADYLFSKLVAGSNITLTKNNPGGVETITIDSAGGGGGGGSTNYTFIAPLQVASGTNVSIAANGIDNTLIRQSAGVSVIGRAANSTGNVADITAASDNQIFGRFGGSLSFATLPDDLSNQRVNVMLNGSSVGTRKTINIIEGDNVEATITDNSGSNRIDIELDSTGGGTNITTTAAGGFKQFTTVGASEAVLGDDYAVVDFGDGAIYETDTLTSGTYIITAVVDFNQYREEGQQILIKLINTEPVPEVDQQVPGSEKLCGPQVISGSFLGNWVITSQGLVTITSSGKVQVHARNTVSGDTNSKVVKNRSTISWIKIN